MSTAPAGCCGVGAMTLVGPTSTTSVAAAPPNVTWGTDEKLLPEIVTFVPPNVVPDEGVTPVTATDDGLVLEEQEEKSTTPMMNIDAFRTLCRQVNVPAPRLIGRPAIMALRTRL